MREGAGSVGQERIEVERVHGVVTGRGGPNGFWLSANNGSEAFASKADIGDLRLVEGDLVSWIPMYRSGTFGAEAGFIRRETLQPKIATSEQLARNVPTPEQYTVTESDPLDQILECFAEDKRLDDLAEHLDNLVNEGVVPSPFHELYGEAIMRASSRNNNLMVSLASAVLKQRQQAKGAKL